MVEVEAEAMVEEAEEVMAAVVAAMAAVVAMVGVGVMAATAAEEEVVARTTVTEGVIDMVVVVVAAAIEVVNMTTEEEPSWLIEKNILVSSHLAPFKVLRTFQCHMTSLVRIISCDVYGLCIKNDFPEKKNVTLS